MQYIHSSFHFYFQVLNTSNQLHRMSWAMSIANIDQSINPQSIFKLEMIDRAQILTFKSLHLTFVLKNSCMLKLIQSEKANNSRYPFNSSLNVSYCTTYFHYSTCSINSYSHSTLPIVVMLTLQSCLYCIIITLFPSLS